MVVTVAVILLAFLCGALPFSVWTGRYALQTDIRAFGDGNPGATNVLRAGGKKWGAVALLLDYFKGVIPIGLAHYSLGYSGWALALIAIAPIAGHAYSPFLHWRGGKAVAVTFGIWTGLTVWEGPTILGISLGLAFLVVSVDGWAVMLAMLGLLVYYLTIPPAFNPLQLRPELWPTILATWAGSALILAIKHRSDLRKPPQLHWRFSR